MALGNSYGTQGYLGKPKDVMLNEYMIIDHAPHRIHKIVVAEFTISEDDPDFYAAIPLLDWQNSEAGQWVMQRSMQTPTWYRYLESMTYYYKYVVVAWLKDVDHTFYQLKWGQKV